MADESPLPPEGSEPGPVHYQISITGRQAGTFFFLLLLALGLSFFLGMKTGAAARKGPDAVTQLADASDLPVPTIAPEERREAGESVPTPTPEAGERKLGFEDAPPATPTATPPTPAPRPTVAPTATPAPTKAMTKTVKAPEKTPAPKPPEKTPAPKTAEKGLFVQVLATKDGKKADELVKKLKRQGLKADVSTSSKSPDLFAVRVGPYADKPKAEAARKKIVKANKELKDSRVVSP